MIYPPQRSVEKMIRLDQVIAHGKKHSFTGDDIAKMFGITRYTADLYIRRLRRAGELYVHKYLRTSGSLKPVYKSGNKPDAIKPNRKTQYEYDKKYKAKVRHIQRSTVVVKRDIAASWF